MPKAVTKEGPLSCLFAINKPTGIVSMNLLNKLQPIFQASSLFTKLPDLQGGTPKRKWKLERVKMGQGGTLDPLADGVLVVGTNNATKTLAKFLDCTKEYRTVGLFGCSTDTYDSEGKRVNMQPFTQITREKIEAVLAQFRGEIEQVPPIFSALKMDGKPLYEYARSGTPLPRPIAARKVTVSKLELINFTEAQEQLVYGYPKVALAEAEKTALEGLQKMINEGGTDVPTGVVEKKRDDAKKGDVAAMPVDEPAAEESSIRAPTFEIRMTVSSGTYVRSIVHDIGIALGSSAHVVKLTRTRQGEFTLNDEPIASTSSAVINETPSVPEIAIATPMEVIEAAEGVDPVKTTEEKVEETTVEKALIGGCIEWAVFADAIKAHDAGVRAAKGERLPWEIELLHRCQQI